MTKVLVIDNYDSFVYTLVGYLEQLGATTEVIRNDDPAAANISELLAKYDAVLISPGPGNPQQAGATIPIIKHAAEVAKPLLGVCLGHQALAEAYGAKVTHAEQLLHGKTTPVNHEGDGFFADVPAKFKATRYHSLAVVKNTLPDDLLVTASTDDGVVMALKHRELPLYGVQYHPESVLTEYGYQQLGNWLESVGVKGAAAKAKELSAIIGSQQD
ncbi:gamma-glutamyl-gamma-aminobutyrate hydrolase family protein [Canibacter sp. lx-45]|uniref:anthranilate synthase component II n=1 Tax=Canibacter zhuwentaonis TaxID=2837491 RepID=UPI001BDD1308|nr:gamma-glutamyl-gamma-aminobutyrate hydrolase family protein [Canibacter zhuwentaonis]MBT1035823.1 gamma-glutamyl-gamma-aminobutyrate hydrolase family protein [Canibacter zhuwentaonis]